MGLSRRSNTAAAPDASQYRPDEADEGYTSEDENEQSTRSSSVSRRGWGQATKKIKETAKAFVDDWTPPNGATLVKFLEDEPFITVGQHWLNEISDGKRSFNCLEDADPPQRCPLCARGHDPRALIYFNVVPIVVDNEVQEEPTVHALKAGPLLTDLIKSENEGKTGPLSRHYWVLKRWETKQGRRTKVNYSLSVARGRDLADEWELDPEAVAEAVTGLELFGDEIAYFNPKAELQEIAEKYLAND